MAGFVEGRTLMTVKATNKRDGEGEGGECEYNGAVAGFLERLLGVAREKKEEVAFVKEVMAAMMFVDGGLLTREQREKVNGLVIALYADVSNASVKRMVKAVNKALCGKDGSLVSI